MELWSSVLLFYYVLCFSIHIKHEWKIIIYTIAVDFSMFIFSFHHSICFDDHNFCRQNDDGLFSCLFLFNKTAWRFVFKKCWIEQKEFLFFFAFFKRCVNFITLFTTENSRTLPLSSAVDEINLIWLWPRINTFFFEWHMIVKWWPT